MNGMTKMHDPLIPHGVWQGLRVGVLGFGRSGQAAARESTQPDDLRDGRSDTHLGRGAASGCQRACDGDFTNNMYTNAQDYVVFKNLLDQPSEPPVYNAADLNCNGYVNAQDYVLFRKLMGSPPGPSGLVP